VLVTGWQQALTVLLIVIPGFVHQGILSRLRGPTPEDRDLGTRILRALRSSGLFALIYLFAVGPSLVHAVTRPRTYVVEHPRLAALVLLVGVFAVPAGVAVVQHARAARRLYPKLPWKKVFHVYDATPTAWDFAVNRVGPGYVRVLTKDGEWVGGYAGEDSFYTNYPEAREIFVERGWQLGDDGDFQEEITGSAGRWIQCDAAAVVEFIRPQESNHRTKGWARLITISAIAIWVWCSRSRG
jgi:Family of unknown function (DUF6338)